MNLEKIEIGKLYKYKDLCKMFREERKTSNSKKAQIKKWATYCNIIKQPKANFMITEIYQEPKEQVDGRVNNGNHPNSVRSIYKDDIDEILKWVIGENYHSEFITTLSKLAEESNIVNENYKAMNKSKSDFFKKLRSSHKTTNATALNNMTYSIKDLVTRTINSSLDRLAREGLIKLQKGYVICEKTGFFDETTKEELINTRMADEKEISIINELEKEIKEELNIRNNKVLSIDEELRNKYYRELERKVKRELKYVDTLFKGYEITRLDEDISDKSKEQIDLHKKQLNQTVIEQLSKKFVRIYKNTKRELRNKKGFGVLEIDRYKLDIIEKSYLRDAIKVGKVLLDISLCDISNDEEHIHIITTQDKQQEVLNDNSIQTSSVENKSLKREIRWAFIDNEILISDEEMQEIKQQREQNKWNKYLKQNGMTIDDFDENGQYILPF